MFQQPHCHLVTNNRWLLFGAHVLLAFQLDRIKAPIYHSVNWILFPLNFNHCKDWHTIYYIVFYQKGTSVMIEDQFLCSSNRIEKFWWTIMWGESVFATAIESAWINICYAKQANASNFGHMHFQHGAFCNALKKFSEGTTTCWSQYNCKHSLIIMPLRTEPTAHSDWWSKFK